MTPDPRDPLQAEIEAALSDVNLQDMEPDGSVSGRGAAREGLARGTVVGVSGDEVIVELGPRVQGAISASEFDSPPEVGQVFEFTLNGQGEDGLWNLSRKAAVALAAWDDLYVGARVKAEVTGTNKGGLEMKVGPLRAFMPISQIDLARVEETESFVGQSWVSEVVELDPERKKIVLSRRRVLAAEREAAREETLGRLIPGSQVTGTVTRVEPFGAFVDLGGVEGLVHVSNLSRQRVENPEDVVHKGQQVKVLVLEVKEGGKRIGLGMKQLEPDPWDDARYRLPEDSVVTGKVVKLMDFGAFVDLGDGLEGLLHASQMLPNQRVQRPSDVVAVGQEIPVRVLAVDEAQRRISLSRLDSRGAVLGSEEAADSSTIDEVLEAGEHERGATTNLGDLFRRALRQGE